MILFLLFFQRNDCPNNILMIPISRLAKHSGSSGRQTDFLGRWSNMVGGHYSHPTPITIELVNYKFVFVAQPVTDTPRSDRARCQTCFDCEFVFGQTPRSDCLIVYLGLRTHGCHIVSEVLLWLIVFSHIENGNVIFHMFVSPLLSCN